MENNQQTESGNQNNSFYFKTLGRIAIIFLIGFTVYMLVSMIMLIFLTKSSKEIKVPQLIGKRYVDVHNTLIRNGLRPSLSFKEMYDVEDGLVLQQHPDAGNIISENDKINITVSRSNLILNTPNLIGMDLPKATNKLKNLHIYGKSLSMRTGIISYISSEKYPNNVIISQNPKANEKITPGVKINVLVSSGKVKENNKMPAIVGQSIDLVYDLLIAKGLYVNEKIVKTGDIKKSGIITSQSISKNRRIKKGQTVSVNVLWYDSKDHPYHAYEKINYVIPNQQKSGIFEAIVKDSHSERIRFSKKMRPGQKISFIFHRTGNVKIYITRDKVQFWVKEITVD